MELAYDQHHCSVIARPLAPNSIHCVVVWQHLILQAACLPMMCTRLVRGNVFLQEMESKQIAPELYPYNSRGPVGSHYLAAKHGVRWGDMVDNPELDI